MKSEDEYPAYPRNRPNQNKLAVLAQKILISPIGYFGLLILSFGFGYIIHSQKPLISSQLETFTNTKAGASSDDLAAHQPVIYSQVVKDLAAHHDFPHKCSNHPVPSDQVRQTILDRVFNGSSPWKNFPPAHVNSLLFPDWAKGWGSQTPVFEHLINQVRPKVIIEVGTFLGASATHMHRLTQKLGLNSQIICIDDYRGWPGYYDEEKSLKMVNGDSMLLYQFMKNVANADATESIIYLPFSTSTALGGLCDWGVYGDLVEIDAAHDFHSAWVDINNGYKVLKKPGGVMFGHDIVWPGVSQAVHIFARLNGYQVRVDGEHWVLY